MLNMLRKPVANITCCINPQSVRSKLQFSCLVLSSDGATRIVSIRLWCWIFFIGWRWIISWLGTWAIKDASPCQWLASGKIIKEPHKGCCLDDFYWYWVHHGAIIWCSIVAATLSNFSFSSLKLASVLLNSGVEAGNLWNTPIPRA